MENTMLQIYIVEDDRNIREIEAFALKNAGYKVEEFSTGSVFLKKLEKTCPDFIIMDVLLPDADGIRIVEKLRNRKDTKKIPILLVSGKTSELDIVKGLDAGADDYLVKPFGVMELMSRVKALLRRVSKQNPSGSGGEWILMPDGETLKAAGKTILLTHKEYELIRILMENEGKAVQRDFLMESIWGIDYLGESRTLDMHIRTLRKKLDGQGKQIVTVRQVGYRLEESGANNVEGERT